MNAIPNASYPLPRMVQRQVRIGPVIVSPHAPALEAANEAEPLPVEVPAGPSATVHFGHACLARRFGDWLRGSQVLEAPLPARCLDSLEHQAQALARQRRAVRERSYVPARTALLFP